MAPYEWELFSIRVLGKRNKYHCKFCCPESKLKDDGSPWPSFGDFWRFMRHLKNCVKASEEAKTKAYLRIAQFKREEVGKSANRAAAGSSSNSLSIQNNLKKVSVKGWLQGGAHDAVDEAWARFIFGNGIASHVVDSPEFKQAIRVTIRRASELGGYNPANRRKLVDNVLHVVLRSLEKATRVAISSEERISPDGTRHEGRMQIGLDGWASQDRRHFVNFMLYNGNSVYSVGGIDTSMEEDSAENNKNLMLTKIREIETNYGCVVFCIITDGAFNMTAALDFVVQERPDLVILTCAAHKFDLILEEIGDIPLVTKTLERAIEAVKFFRNHGFLRNKLELALKDMDEAITGLLLPNATRFGTKVIMLTRLFQCRHALTHILLDEDTRAWNSAQMPDKRTRFNSVLQTLTNAEFWTDARLVFRCMFPVMKALRHMDEDSASMGKVYYRFFAVVTELQELETLVREHHDVTEALIVWEDCKRIVELKWGEYEKDFPIISFAYACDPEFYSHNPFLCAEVQQNFIKFVTSYSRDRYACLREFNDYKKDTETALELQNGTVDSKSFWEFRLLTYPNLAPLAVRVLSLSASTSCVERNNSEMGFVMGPQRQRLGSERAVNLTDAYTGIRAERTSQRTVIREWMSGEDVSLSSPGVDAEVRQLTEPQRGGHEAARLWDRMMRARAEEKRRLNNTSSSGMEVIDPEIARMLKAADKGIKKDEVSLAKKRRQREARAERVLSAAETKQDKKQAKKRKNDSTRTIRRAKKGRRDNSDDEVEETLD